MGHDQMTILMAFSAGLVSFFSPCVLPLLPTFSAILAGGVGQKERQPSVYLHASCFLAGFTLVFIAMGASASLAGQWLFDYQPLLKKAGAVLIIIFGCILAGLLKIPFMEREYRPFFLRGLEGPGGAFLLGMAFTIGWTPCTGPVLATILLYAGSTATLSQGAFLLFVYAMGFSVPFFLLAVVLRKYIFHLRKFYAFLPMLQKVAGIVLVFLGIAVWMNWVERGLAIVTSFFQ